MSRRTLVLVTAIATAVLWFNHKKLMPWLREKAWPSSERFKVSATAALWKIEGKQPARLHVIRVVHYATTCALASVASCSLIGWGLLGLVPKRPVLVMETMVAIGKLLAFASGAATLWTALPAGWWKRRAQRDGEGSNESGAAAEPVKSGKPSKLPVTVVTGYLGAGKSTLVQRILEEKHGLRILVVENEVGEVGIDNELLLQHTAKEDIVRPRSCPRTRAPPA